MTFIPSSASIALLGRSLGDSNGNQSNKSILQHLYFIIAVVIALFFVSLRIYILRRRNRPVAEFFTIGSSSSYYNSQAPGDNAFSSSYQPSYPMPLAPPPSVYRPNRRVNAADTDAAGRRFGGPDDPDWDGKDMLPAYNNIDRPPKYDFGGVPAQGYSPPAGNYPGDDSVVAGTEALPHVDQSLTSMTRTSHSDGVDSAPSAPHHEYPQAPSQGYDL
ncbi:uncharacterized protein EDB91DRAFT_692565 [Suillus paluster]|uniref:uncharacterized protein n=1 Tax=Suillus paluster TaxID=48578 RepID=UPI001B879893|nr:uncharacterized protein EDB91DRAFT_692565 [Suillus paluster]KAG1750497.1 hypothetical protein EDB91DRAFT_692565 [Suillus paluster]